VNRRPSSRVGRVLLWIVLIVVALIVLSVLFGGFQKGTNSGLTMLRGVVRAHLASLVTGPGYPASQLAGQPVSRSAS
jgi:autotransporter translocation and assembly factor TamB